MTRYGPMFGPDITFLGVERCDLDDPATFAGADVVVVGAPFDGGTSHRPGTRFGPQAIRRPTTCRTTAPGRSSRCASTGCATCGCSTPATSRCARRHRAVAGRADRGGGDGRDGWRDPRRPRRRPLDHAGRRHRRRPSARRGPGVGGALRRARRHRRHRVRVALRARPADAAAHRVGGGPRRPVPADRAARLLAGARDAGLDGRAADALLRDDRDRAARPRRLPRPRPSRSPSTTATASSSRSTSTSCDPGHAPGTGTPEPGGLTARATARRRPPGLPRAAGRGRGRRRGVPALRPRRHHRAAGQPGRAGGALGHRGPQAGTDVDPRRPLLANRSTDEEN